MARSGGAGARDAGASRGRRARHSRPPGDVRAQFAAWQKKRLLDLYLLWDAEIRKRNPGAVFFPNGFDQIRDSVSVPILFADRQCRSEFQLPWQNGKFAKEARSTSGSKPIVGIFSVGFEEPYRWKDSTQNPNEVRLWAVDGIAQGFRPWVVKFNAKPLDHRWFKPVEDLYVWHWKNEKYLRNERPLARVGLVSGRAGRAGPRVRVLPRPGGSPYPLRNSPGQPTRPGARAAIPSPGPAEYRQPLRRAVRPVEVFRRKGRRAGCHPRDLTLRRARQAVATISAWPAFSAPPLPAT